MDAKMLQTLSVISFAVAAVLFVLALFFWFFFKIPTVIGDLSGRNARKSIAKMRAANEKTGAKSYKTDKTNAGRGQITAAMPTPPQPTPPPAPVVPTPVPVPPIVAIAPDRPETGLLTDNRAVSFASEATGILTDDATGPLMDPNATAPLISPAPARVGGKRLEMLDEVMLIHTSEVIG